MKTALTLTLVLIITLLAGCGGTEPQPVIDQGATSEKTSAPVSAPASVLSEDYPEALTVRNQLVLGTLRLEDDPALAVTAEQAATLLPLWQALRSLTQSGTAATAEIDALVAQIEGEMTPAQLQAIAAMQLTQADIQALAQEWGLTVGDGTGTGQPGEGSTLSEAERATRQAERGLIGEANSSGGVSTALLDRLIQLLEERAG